MNQLTQNLKTGELATLEVPYPAQEAKSVAVRNHFSVISPGTEGKRVHDAKLGYIGKARARRKELNQVMESVKNNGLKQTYRLASNKLDMPSALGYSCAGQVLSVGSQIKDIRVGEWVACGGSGAVHAEVVAVPANLCAKIPEGVRLEHAAFTTIGAIAVQGVRQAQPGLGENCVVIGLGLIGQLTVQLLRAAGVRSVGIDLQDHLVKLAEENGADLALQRSHPNLVERIFDFTGGFGTDAVIITAGTTSLDPIELAGTLCRQKGRVIVVGDVPTGFSRPNYYKKELELRMSCSYGPGRYDPDYEDKGMAYPIGYVRWTENRNMQAFLQLLADDKLNLDKLITHTFPFERAEQAYETVINKSEPSVGVLLEYDSTKEITSKVEVNGRYHQRADRLAIGFIGAGSFAQNVLLPKVRDRGELVGVATARGNTARSIADKYGFAYCTCDAKEIMDDDAINTIFVATRHNLHAHLVQQALRQGKHVFVEKPLCLNETELAEIRETYRSSNVELMVGFNRRFAPFVQRIKSVLPEELPKAVHYRINAGATAPDHWIHDPDIGGGRIIGEVCHFVDLALFLTGGRISSVTANVMKTPEDLQDTLVVNLAFENGSVASISYFSNGSKRLSKEYLEVFCGGQVAVVDDFKTLQLFGKKVFKTKLRRQDKGHAEEIKQFIQCIRSGGPSPIAFDEIYLSTLATFKIIDSIRNRATMLLS